MPKHEPLEEYAARQRCVFVPVSVELLPTLSDGFHGPYELEITQDPSAHPLLRTLVLRKVEEPRP